MNEETVKQVEVKARDLFIRLGFKHTIIGTENLFERKGRFYRFTYVNGLRSFIVESALSSTDAMLNVFEDSDSFTVTNGEDALMSQLEFIIRKYYLDT